MSIPLSLYIHFPWCIRKCPYCDFNSHTLKTALEEEQYITKLIIDFDKHLPKLKHRSISSIFMGGGTPSLFQGQSIAKLLHYIKDNIATDDDLEITMEVNPGTVEAGRFADYFTAGVNRLSLGIQSFSNSQLKNLGRIHDAEQACYAIQQVKTSGFTNFNLDIMYGLPMQNLATALADLSMAFSFQPTHISWYQLTLEPNTLFHHHPPKLPSDDQIITIEQQGLQQFADFGFDHYEVSAFTKPGSQCKHNMNYWRFGDYLGIGAGAHSKITADDFTICRFSKQRHPSHYLATSELIVEQKILSTNDVIFEYMLNNLRLNAEVKYQHFSKSTGLKFNLLAQLVEQAEQKGFVISNQKGFKKTKLGQQFLNDLQAIFLN